MEKYLVQIHSMLGMEFEYAVKTIAEMDDAQICNKEALLEVFEKYVDEWNEKIDNLVKINCIDKIRIMYRISKIKLAMLIRLMFIKIRSTYSRGRMCYKSSENDEFADYEFEVPEEIVPIYKQSLTSDAIGKIVETNNLGHVERYVEWLSTNLSLKMNDIVCASIMIKKILSVKNDKILSLLKMRYDLIMIVIIILIRKMYGDGDIYYSNQYYSRRMKINLYELNELEIIMLMYINVSISDSEYEEEYPIYLR